MPLRRDTNIKHWTAFICTGMPEISPTPSDDPGPTWRRLPLAPEIAEFQQHYSETSLHPRDIPSLLSPDLDGSFNFSFITIRLTYHCSWIGNFPPRASSWLWYLTRRSVPWVATRLRYHLCDSRFCFSFNSYSTASNMNKYSDKVNYKYVNFIWHWPQKYFQSPQVTQQLHLGHPLFLKLLIQLIICHIIRL